MARGRILGVLQASQTVAPQAKHASKQWTQVYTNRLAKKAVTGAAESDFPSTGEGAHLEHLPADGVAGQQVREELGHIAQLVRLQPVDQRVLRTARHGAEQSRSTHTEKI